MLRKVVSESSKTMGINNNGAEGSGIKNLQLRIQEVKGGDAGESMKGVED